MLCRRFVSFSGQGLSPLPIGTNSHDRDKAQQNGGYGADKVRTFRFLTHINQTIMEEEEDVVPLEEARMTAWEKVGSLVTRGGEMLILIVLPLLIGLEALLLIGLPISLTPSDLLINWYYWLFMFMIMLGTVSEMLFSLGAARAASGAAIVGMLFMALAWLFHAAGVVTLLIVLLTCEGDAMCAGNMDSGGSVIGPYDGPSSRFLGVFVVSIIGLVIYLIGILVSFQLWSALRVVERNLLARAVRRRPVRDVFMESPSPEAIGSARDTSAAGMRRMVAARR